MAGEEQLTDQLLNLRTWAQIIRDFVTALGILVAGGFSFYTFVLGRTFAPNVQMQFALKQVIDSIEGKAAVVSITVKNSGQTDVRKQKCLVCYKIMPESSPSFSALAELETLDTKVDPLTPGVKWKIVFDDLEGLEPGEVNEEEFVVHLGQFVIFKVAGSFQKRPRFARLRGWWQRLGEQVRRDRSDRLRVRRQVRTVSSGKIFDVRRFVEEDQSETDAEPET